MLFNFSSLCDHHYCLHRVCHHWYWCHCGVDVNKAQSAQSAQKCSNVPRVPRVPKRAQKCPECPKVPNSAQNAEKMPRVPKNVKKCPEHPKMPRKCPELPNHKKFYLKLFFGTPCSFQLKRVQLSCWKPLQRSQYRSFLVPLFQFSSKVAATVV